MEMGGVFPSLFFILGSSLGGVGPGVFGGSVLLYQGESLATQVMHILY